MTPEPRLAILLASIDADIGSLDGEAKAHWIRRHTASWQHRVPDILDAMRAALSAELLRGLPIEPSSLPRPRPDLDGEVGERVALDGGVEAA